MLSQERFWRINVQPEDLHALFVAQLVDPSASRSFRTLGIHNRLGGERIESWPRLVYRGAPYNLRHRVFRLRWLAYRCSLALAC